MIPGMSSFMKIFAVILGLLMAGSVIAGGQAAAYQDLQSYSKISSYLSNRTTTGSYLESLMERAAGDSTTGSATLPVPTISTMDSSKISEILKQRTIRINYRTYSGPTLSEEEAARIAISAIEQSFGCDTTFRVTSARLGSSAPAYATMNPCWYMNLEGRYTNLAGCPICMASYSQNGRTVYACACPSGIVVLDAVTGEVQMVSHVMCLGHFFENGEIAPFY